MQRTTHLFTLICWVLIISCSKKTVDDPVTPPVENLPAATFLDVAYGSNALQKADVYLPANRTTATKTLFLLHGGSWTSGDKADMNTFILSARATWPDICIINMNYRLANGLASNQHPAQMNDIRALLDLTDSKVGEWKISKNYALCGVSAGAHLASLYAYVNDAEKRVKALVNVVGPVDLTDSYYTTNPLFPSLATALLGTTWSTNPSILQDVSPTLKVTANAPPTFMAYAGLDLLVPISNGRKLRDKLVSLGVKNSYNEYPNEGHEMSPTSILDVISKMIPFFQANF